MYLRENSLAGKGGEKGNPITVPFPKCSQHFHTHTPPRPGADPGLKDYSEFQRITPCKGDFPLSQQGTIKYYKSCRSCSSTAPV